MGIGCPELHTRGDEHRDGHRLDDWICPVGSGHLKAMRVEADHQKSGQGGESMVNITLCVPTVKVMISA